MELGLRGVACAQEEGELSGRGTHQAPAEPCSLPGSGQNAVGRTCPGRVGELPFLWGKRLQVASCHAVRNDGGDAAHVRESRWDSILKGSVLPRSTVIFSSMSTSWRNRSSQGSAGSPAERSVLRAVRCRRETGRHCPSDYCGNHIVTRPQSTINRFCALGA